MTNEREAHIEDLRRQAATLADFGASTKTDYRLVAGHFGILPQTNDTELYFDLLDSGYSYGQVSDQILYHSNTDK